MRRGIIAGGNWILDHVKMINQWPEQDNLVSIITDSSSNGGSPYNILVDLARLGAPFPLAGIGLLGEDEKGRQIKRDCERNCIDITQLRTTPAAPTSYTDVMTEMKTGRRTFFHQRGANALLAPEHFDFSQTVAKYFHLGYILLLDELDRHVKGRPRALEVLTMAQSAGLLTSLDCVSEESDRFQSTVLPVLPAVNVLFANDFETSKLVGRPLRGSTGINKMEVKAAAAQLLRYGIRSWVIIHFPEGVYACSPSGANLWQPSLDINSRDIVGAAGAGDALAAGVLYGLHEGWEMRDCLKLAVCAAGMSLFHPSSSQGVASIAECLALGKRVGYRGTCE